MQSSWQVTHRFFDPTVDRTMLVPRPRRAPRSAPGWPGLVLIGVVSAVLGFSAVVGLDALASSRAATMCPAPPAARAVAHSMATSNARLSIAPAMPSNASK